MQQTDKTTSLKRVLSAVALAGFWLAGAGGGLAAGAAPMATNKPAAEADGTVVIDNTTVWRHLHVEGPSRIRLPDGKLEVAEIAWGEKFCGGNQSQGSESARVRDRRLSVEIPASLLRPGANVLAVEAHVSPLTNVGRELLHKFHYFASFKMCNRAADPLLASVRARLEADLQRRLDQMGDAFLEGRRYLERDGLTHYGEVKYGVLRQWVDPWQPT